MSRDKIQGPHFDQELGTMLVGLGILGTPGCLGCALIRKKIKGVEEGGLLMECVAGEEWSLRDSQGQGHCTCI